MNSINHSLIFIFISTFIFSGELITISGKPTTTTTNTTDFIRTSCNATLYPSLCINSLSSYASTVRHDPRQLAHAAISVSADRASAASAFVSRLSANSSKSLSSRDAGAVKDCVETMKDSVDKLRNSVKEIEKILGRVGKREFAWCVSNVQTWVSAALTDENTCMDGLKSMNNKNNGAVLVRVGINKKVVEVVHTTSNALALVNHMGSPNY
ncbi:Pectinesterase protein [Dioscorea alata]|uniref:Pectinesterase protein n=1 Tax=Dioscorea alata TaxID=55571 RepID=A0ACB7WV03_DIOAL|nr:Pectinesterase protein [Dioscorea alata]